MKGSVDEILFIRENKSKLLRARPMRLGLFGKTLEEALQNILENHPQIIPGTQINPENPPKFLLLRRELPLSGWSLDHLYVDNEGVLTLLETKLFDNPDARREVIGQIVEYGAYASECWEVAKLRQYASEFWQKKGKKLDEVIRDTFGEGVEIEDFWNKVEENIEKRQLRLMIAADKLRPEVRRMIEFLNNEMRNVEVLGLECKFYGEEDQEIVIVSRIIGQTQVTISNRGKGVKIWTPEDLKAACRELQDERLIENFEKILNWAINSDCFIQSKTITPSFGISSLKKERLFSIINLEIIFFYIKEKLFSGGKNDRDALVDELKRYGFLDKKIDPEKVVDGRNLSRRLSEMTSDEVDKFLSIIEKYCYSST